MKTLEEKLSIDYGIVFDDKSLLDNFDFDMAILSFPMSQMPGNEQKEMWGSDAADNKGSMNLAGVKNPAADKLIDGFIKAQDKPDYLAYLRAFDRVMRHEYYSRGRHHEETVQEAGWPVHSRVRAGFSIIPDVCFWDYFLRSAVL